MKKVIYSIIIIFAVIVWLTWGGFSNPMGTFMCGIGAAFAITVAGDKMHENRAKAEDETK